jgi:hypothetical protein
MIASTPNADNGGRELSRKWCFNVQLLRAVDPFDAVLP